MYIIICHGKHIYIIQKEIRYKVVLGYLYIIYVHFFSVVIEYTFIVLTRYLVKLTLTIF